MASRGDEPPKAKADDAGLVVHLPVHVHRGKEPVCVRRGLDTAAGGGVGADVEAPRRQRRTRGAEGHRVHRLGGERGGEALQGRLGRSPRNPVRQGGYPVAVVEGARLNAAAGARIRVAVEQALAVHIGGAPQGKAGRAFQDRLGKAGCHIYLQRVGGQGRVDGLGAVIVAIGHIHPALLPVWEGVGGGDVIDPQHGPALGFDELVIHPLGAHRDPAITRARQRGRAVRHEVKGARGVVDGPERYPAGVLEVALAVVLQRDDRILGLDHQLLLHRIELVIERVELHPYRARGQVERPAPVPVQGDGEVPHLAGGGEAPRFDVALGHRLAVLVGGRELGSQRRQGEVVQLDLASGIVDLAADIAADSAVAGAVGGALVGAPGQDQTRRRDAGMGQLPAGFADADGLAAAVGVVHRGAPAEQDRRVHIRQRAKGQQHRTGSVVELGRAIAAIHPPALTATVVLQVIPFTLGHKADGERARCGSRLQGDGVGIAPVVRLDGDPGRVGDTGRTGRRPERHGLAGGTVVRTLVVEVQPAPPIVDGPDHGSRQHQFAAAVGDDRGAYGHADGARLGAGTEEQALARGNAGHGAERHAGAARVHQGGQLAGCGQVHRRGFGARCRHQLGKDGVGLYLHGAKGGVLGELGGGEILGTIGHYRLAQGGLGVGDGVIGGGLFSLEAVAQWVGQLAGHHQTLELAAVTGHQELAQLGTDRQHPHILLELAGLVLVPHQAQHLADLGDAQLLALEEADRPLAFQLGVVQEALPFRATRQIAFHPIPGRGTGIVVVLGGHQRQPHVRVCRRQQHDHVGTEIGVGVVGLHCQKTLAQVDHPIGAVKIRNVGEHGVMFPAQDLVAGDAATAIRGVGHALTGHQLDIASKNGHGVSSITIILIFRSYGSSGRGLLRRSISVAVTATGSCLNVTLNSRPSCRRRVIFLPGSASMAFTVSTELRAHHTPPLDSSVMGRPTTLTLSSTHNAPDTVGVMVCLTGDQSNSSAHCS
ncbi:hypothetical protein D3C85_131400 [compost metagenome]